ncbi:acrylyl-CoA reductase family protein [Amphibacillus sediminis]|uniref:acrylyl-CoA reductase family protein n=1 Tax=Amphibacillus sediminis TaxID=360185 RepID=UPI000829817C|nr:acryloyl-CoA reductase [Amphibacillus sediminis]
MTHTFKAYRLTKRNDQVKGEVQQLSIHDLPEGEVLIRVHYSGINYKDAMANMENTPIIKDYPITPGIDLAGEVVESSDDRFTEGDPVIVTSYDLGVSHDGGYSEYARVKAEWVIPLPEGLTLKQAMILGTAGLTAALSIDQLQQQQIMPESGKLLVTGASGGVGSIATAMLANLGYHVEASTGKVKAHDWLYQLGAKKVIDRTDVTGEKLRTIDRQTWAGAVDPVGGSTLASIISKLNYNGAVAVSGLTGGVKVPTSVHPFILRGIHLIGIDSVYCPMQVRQHVWQRMATDLKLTVQQFDTIVAKEVCLEDLEHALPLLLETNVIGRIILNLS